MYVCVNEWAGGGGGGGERGKGKSKTPAKFER